VTGGSFSALWNGTLDPTGLVKGWAIERASQLLRDCGSLNHAVNGGGDMQLAGEAEPGRRPWRVGITDPQNGSRVITVLTARDSAVATSGTAERGAHIVDPLTGRAATGLASASVVGPSLTFADAYATAAFVMGESAVRWIEGVLDYETLLVEADGELSRSSGWRDAECA
jgi:thiamine biosynthesis lipoprotein